MARVFNFLNIRWQFQPKTFDIGGQNYTPDFYLPDQDVWVEVKNFLSPYSKQRDEKFRELYPHHRLVLILRPDYLELQRQFADRIPEWEFSRGTAPTKCKWEALVTVTTP